MELDDSIRGVFGFEVGAVIVPSPQAVAVLPIHTLDTP